MKSYEDISDDLRSNHLYPDFIMEGKEIVSLEVKCPAIQSIPRLKVVQDVCGDDFKCDFVSKDEVIVIQKK